jgi:hypothetical protein
MHQKGAAVPESGSRALRIGVAGFWRQQDRGQGRGFLKFVALPGQAVGQLPEDRQKSTRASAVAAEARVFSPSVSGRWPFVGEYPAR